jgi:hypothetical protein
MRSLHVDRPGPPGTALTRRFARLTAKTIALAFALAFVVGACDVYGQSGGGTGGNSGDLTLSVAAPTDGAEVSIPFEVAVTSNVPIGPPETGNHHLHIYYDGRTATGDYDVVETGTVQVTRELTPGEHTIVVSLRNADHSAAGPSQTITVVVGGSSGAGGPSPTAPTAPQDYSY